MRELKKELNDNGYLVLKKFFTKEEINNIYSEAKQLFAIQINRTLGVEVNINDKDAFDKAMFDFFQLDFISFVNTGKQVQHLISMHRLATDERIINVLKEIGYEFPAIAVRPAMQFNSRNLSKNGSHWKLGAHQDWRTGQGSLDSVVFWFPLIDCGSSLGALQIIPKSHRLGLLKSDTTGYGGKIQEDLPEGDFIQTSFEVGDLLIFSAFLVHRSGENITQNIRWSMQLRYNNMAEHTFQERGFPMPYIYKPEESLVTSDFPKIEQLEQLFT